MRRVDVGERINDEDADVRNALSAFP